MAYLWAFYLFNTDKTASSQVVKWCETALERKQVWEGDVFVSRVYGLLKLKTFAAQEQWKQEEDRAPQRAELHAHETMAGSTPRGSGADGVVGVGAATHRTSSESD
jgi:hypothetical protein